MGKPTVINNVETMASVSLIMQAGPEEFGEYGTGIVRELKHFHW